MLLSAANAISNVTTFVMSRAGLAPGRIATLPIRISLP